MNMFTLDGLREELSDILETVGKDGLPGPRDLDVALDAILSCVQSAVDTCKNEEALAQLKTALEPAQEYPMADILKAVVEVLPEPQKAA